MDRFVQNTIRLCQLHDWLISMSPFAQMYLEATALICAIC